MGSCDRCGSRVEMAELACTGCGNVGHGECEHDISGLGNVCDRCWAYLSHVEHVISCAGGCSCLRDYPDLASSRTPGTRRER